MTAVSSWQPITTQEILTTTRWNISFKSQGAIYEGFRDAHLSPDLLSWLQAKCDSNGCLVWDNNEQHWEMRVSVGQLNAIEVAFKLGACISKEYKHMHVRQQTLTNGRMLIEVVFYNRA